MFLLSLLGAWSLATGVRHLEISQEGSSEHIRQHAIVLSLEGVECNMANFLRWANPLLDEELILESALTEAIRQIQHRPADEPWENYYPGMILKVIEELWCSVAESGDDTDCTVNNIGFAQFERTFVVSINDLYLQLSSFQETRKTTEGTTTCSIESAMHSAESKHNLHAGVLTPLAEKLRNIQKVSGIPSPALLRMLGEDTRGTGVGQVTPRNLSTAHERIVQAILPFFSTIIIGVLQKFGESTEQWHNEVLVALTNFMVGHVNCPVLPNSLAAISNALAAHEFACFCALTENCAQVFADFVVDNVVPESIFFADSSSPASLLQQAKSVMKSVSLSVFRNTLSAFLGLTDVKRHQRDSSAGSVFEPGYQLTKRMVQERHPSAIADIGGVLKKLSLENKVSDQDLLRLAAMALKPCP